MSTKSTETPAPTAAAADKKAPTSKDRASQAGGGESTASDATSGVADEAIGRPSEWREGRYEQAGKSVEKSVNDPAQREEKAPDTTSTPVTRRDYEK
ncbi:MAG: hypothetical protein M3O06_05700, partial [Pseudomonadota bacterium]|nr:hypothetical protein [Pseudomonadota bacterium]